LGVRWLRRADDIGCHGDKRTSFARQVLLLLLLLQRRTIDLPYTVT